MPRKAPKSDSLLTVLHDSGRRHWRTRMALYKLEARRAGLAIAWHDIAEDPDALDRFGVDPARDRHALYVIDGDGEVFAGTAALALLWSALPSHRRLGHMLASPGASAFADACARFRRLAEPRHATPSRG